MKSKHYFGRIINGRAVVTVSENGQETLLDPRTDLRNHTMTGFEWGYNSPGQYQLALAILTDHFGLFWQFKALRLYKLFSEGYLSEIDGCSSFSLDSFIVQALCSELMHKLQHNT